MTATRGTKGTKASKPTKTSKPAKTSKLAKGPSARKPKKPVTRETAGLGARGERDRLAEELRDAREQLALATAQVEASAARSTELAAMAQLAAMQAQQIFDSSRDPMWLVNESCGVSRVNAAMLQLLDRTREEVLNSKCHDLLRACLCQTDECLLTRVRSRKQSIECDLRFQRAAQAPLHFIVTATPFCGLEGETLGVLESFKDITQRKTVEDSLRRANLELEQLATVDSLTKLANRRRFDEILSLEWRRAAREQTPLALILGDVDQFKDYNDRYGHPQGDACLEEVGNVIATQLKRPADFAARYGGEEFAVVLPNTSREGAAAVAQRIRHEMIRRAVPHRMSTAAAVVTLSFGVASIIPRPPHSPADLIEAADQALYRAKAEGRNRVMAAPSFDSGVPPPEQFRALPERA